MSTVNSHVFSHGMEDTRAAIEGWRQRHWIVLRAWVALSLAIALALLGAVWVVAGLLTPDITPIHLPGLTEPSEPGDLLPILWRNSLPAVTLITVLIAIPALLVAATIEVYVWPHILEALSPVT